MVRIGVEPSLLDDAMDMLELIQILSKASPKLPVPEQGLDNDKIKLVYEDIHGTPWYLYYSL